MTVDMGIREMMIRQRNEAFNRSGQKGIPFKLIKKAKGTFHVWTFVDLFRRDFSRLLSFSLLFFLGMFIALFPLTAIMRHRFCRVPLVSHGTITKNRIFMIEIK